MNKEHLVVFATILGFTVIGLLFWFTHKKPTIPPVPFPQTIEEMKTPPIIIHEDREETADNFIEEHSEIPDDRPTIIYGKD